MNLYGLSPLDIAAILYALLTLLGLLAMYLVFRKVVRKIGRICPQGTLFGTDHKTQLLSLGLVARLFPRLLLSLGGGGFPGGQG